MTFYLEYRPQTINELDLTDVREQLKTMVVSGKLPHAFLFSGPRGLGKTSAARILAKAVNCETRKDAKKTRRERTRKNIEPCNKCDACSSITNGSAMDLIEIDAASNRGIDDIRNLREKIKSSPVSLAKKVYVIDEVHMLTKEAFNALLKTLEEPPEHALFILATTEPHKLPETIISRCTHIKFRKATIEELTRSLKRIVKGEKLKIEKGILKEIAKKADGSFRDGAKVLEQLSFSGKKITKKMLDDLRAGKDKDEFLRSLKERDITAALQFIKAASEEGIDWKDFLIDLLETLRNAVLAHFSILKWATYDFSLEELKVLVRLFSQAAFELKSALISELPIELAVIEYCDSDRDREKKSHKSQITNHKSDKPATNYPGKAEDPRSEYRDQLPTTKSGKIDNAVVALSDVVNAWDDVLKNVKPQNHSIEALLRSCRPKDVNGRQVIIEVFYEFHKGRLETEKCREVVEKSLQKVLNNKSLVVNYVLGSKKKQQTATPEGGQASNKQPRQKAGRQATDERLIENVKNIFGS